MKIFLLIIVLLISNSFTNTNVNIDIFEFDVDNNQFKLQLTDNESEHNAENPFRIDSLRGVKIKHSTNEKELEVKCNTNDDTKNIVYGDKINYICQVTCRNNDVTSIESGTYTLAESIMYREIVSNGDLSFVFENEFDVLTINGSLTIENSIFCPENYIYLYLDLYDGSIENNEFKLKLSGKPFENDNAFELTAIEGISLKSENSKYKVTCSITETITFQTWNDQGVITCSLKGCVRPGTYKLNGLSTITLSDGTTEYNLEENCLSDVNSVQGEDTCNTPSEFSIDIENPQTITPGTNAKVNLKFTANSVGNLKTLSGLSLINSTNSIKLTCPISDPIGFTSDEAVIVPCTATLNRIENYKLTGNVTIIITDEFENEYSTTLTDNEYKPKTSDSTGSASKTNSGSTPTNGSASKTNSGSTPTNGSSSKTNSGSTPTNGSSSKTTPTNGSASKTNSRSTTTSHSGKDESESDGSKFLGFSYLLILLFGILNY